MVPQGLTDDVVLVGEKPFMNYVKAIVVQFNGKKADRVVVKARGKRISRAVDVVEVAAKRFLKEAAHPTEVKIDSEEFETDEGKQVRVSTIEIVLERQNRAA